MVEEQRESVAGRSLSQDSDTLPEIYFNGMELRSSLSDMNLIIMVDGQPQCKLRMSFTTAKTLANNLGESLASFEKLTDRPIMTMDDVRESIAKLDDQ